VPKGREDPQEMKERWLSFPKRGKLGNPDLQEMVDSQEKKVIKAILGCRGGKESQEDTEHPDFTEGSLVEPGSQGFPAPQAPQVPLGQEGLLVFRDFQVTRVSQVLQGPPDVQELME